MSSEPATGAFDAQQYANLASVEAGNYWFESRNRLIVWALARYFPSARSFLDVGCGTGFVLQAIAAAFPSMTLAASDVGDRGFTYARARVPRAEFFVADAAKIRVPRTFDVAGAFDVLEHIPDDEGALAALAAAVEPGGGLLITVPQHRWLWSAADDYSHHMRRYRRRELVTRVTAAGFTVLRVTSFVSVLLPLMAAVRWRERHRPYVPLAAMRVAPATNAALTTALTAERATIRAGLSWPFGGSLLLVARRR
jgi:SAM-dependent methyltransferase